MLDQIFDKDSELVWLINNTLKRITNYFMTLHPKVNQQFYSSLAHYSLFSFNTNKQPNHRSIDSRQGSHINIEEQISQQPTFLYSKGAFINLLYLFIMDTIFIGIILAVYFTLLHKKVEVYQRKYKTEIKSFQIINLLISIVFLVIINLSFVLVQFKNPSIPNLSLYIPQLLKNQEISGLFCYDCGYYVPQSSNIKHCKTCGVCVRQFSHHCGFFDRCIGKGNLKWFYTFEICFLLEIICLLIMIIKLAL